MISDAERREAARRLRGYECPVLPSHQTTREAVDAVVECMGLEEGEEVCTVRNFLDRLADLIDPGEGMDEDGRAALDWVREHGGLDEVEAEWGYAHDRTGLAKSVAVRLGVDPMTDADISEKVMDELDRRLMPDSCEWPVFEDGFPVRIGDDFMDMHGRVHTIHAVKLKDGGEFALIGTDCCGQGFPAGSRVGRPGAAPKVLDADGVEIRVGDTVWHVETGEQCKVVEVDSRSASVDFRADGGGAKHTGSILPANLTHRAPVLAADGKPLRAGQTVWGVDNGIEFTVIGLPRSGEYHAVKLRLDDGAVTGLDPDRLTHQRPVLDADGVPLEVGQTVWHVSTGAEYTVRDVTGGGAHLSNGDRPGGYCRAKYLTHQRPVLDADGEPCKEGDTVYALCDGSEHVVECVNKDGTLKSSKLNSAFYLVASRCTHTKPETVDTWERIEEDVDELVDAEIDGDGSCNAANAYCERHGLGEGTAFALMAQDLVRRARALAGCGAE